jgi:hypothetical protein
MARLGIFRGTERRIEGLFEGVFGRAFRSHVQPVELARKLAKEMDDHKTVSVSRVYVPNEYVLYLSPGDRSQFRGYEASLLVELSSYLAEHARREGYALLSAPRVLLEQDADLSIGEFGIETRLVQPQSPPASPSPPAPPLPVVVAPPSPPPPVSVPAPAAPDSEPVEAEPAPAAELGETRVYGTPEPAPPAAEPEPDHAAVLVAGSRHVLDRPILSVGRSKECDIVVEDPSASRRHAELRRENGAYWVVDLGSTNGTEVNGERVERAQLETGDRITVGQTVLRFERASQ